MLKTVQTIAPNCITAQFLIKFQERWSRVESIRATQLVPGRNARSEPIAEHARLHRLGRIERPLLYSASASTNTVAALPVRPGSKHPAPLRRGGVASPHEARKAPGRGPTPHSMPHRTACHSAQHATLAIGSSAHVAARQSLFVVQVRATAQRCAGAGALHRDRRIRRAAAQP